MLKTKTTYGSPKVRAAGALARSLAATEVPGNVEHISTFGKGLCAEKAQVCL